MAPGQVPGCPECHQHVPHHWQHRRHQLVIPHVPLCGVHSAMQTLLCPNKCAEQVWAGPAWFSCPGQAPLAWHLQRALCPALGSSSPALCVHPIFCPTCSDLLPPGPQMPSLPLGSWSSLQASCPQSLLVLEAEAFPEFLLQVGHTGSPVSMPAHLTEGQGGSEGPHTF